MWGVPPLSPIIDSSVYSQVNQIIAVAHITPWCFQGDLHIFLHIYVSFHPPFVTISQLGKDLIQQRNTHPHPKYNTSGKASICWGPELAGGCRPHCSPTSCPCLCPTVYTQTSMFRASGPAHPKSETWISYWSSGLEETGLDYSC